MVPTSAGAIYAVLAVADERPHAGDDQLLHRRRRRTARWRSAGSRSGRSSPRACPAREDQVPGGRRDGLHRGPGRVGVDARQDRRPSARLAVRRPDICRRVHLGERRRQRGHPVHERQRAGPEGGAAHAPEHPRRTSRGCTRCSSSAPKDIILGNLPLFHVFGLTVTLWLPLDQRDDGGHLPQPARVPGHHHRRPRGGRDDDGGHAGLPRRLPAEVRPGRLRDRAAAHHRRRQVPRIAAPGVPRRARPGRCSRATARRRRARSSRSTRPSTTGPAASARRCPTCRCGWSTTRRASRARSTRSARSSSRATA